MNSMDSQLKVNELMSTGMNLDMHLSKIQETVGRGVGMLQSTGLQGVRHN